MLWKKRFLCAALTALVACSAACACAPERTPATQQTPVSDQPPVITDLSAAPGAHPTPAPGEVLAEVVFFNVGKADAALVRAGGKAYLIDTGTKQSAALLIGALTALGVERLDGVLLTHTHDDHIGGLRALGACMPVALVYRAQFSEMKKKGGNAIDERAQELGAPLTVLRAGDTLNAGGAQFTVLGPLELNADDDNDNSLVLRLTAGGSTVLFTGDMQFAEERTLLNAGTDLSADALKVGNHGNPDATSDAFAAAVSPEIAVISTDTAEDSDSANPRVRAALSPARTYITQDYALGIQLTVTDGGLQITAPERPRDAGTAGLTVDSLDKDAQRVTLRNTGAQVADLSGCMLVSERGGELYRFPGGSVIPAGGVVTLVGEGGAGDYTWSGEQKPWNVKKDDTAALYDRYGTLLDRHSA